MTTVGDARTQTIINLYERFSDSRLGDEVFEAALISHPFNPAEAWCREALDAAIDVADRFAAWCAQLPGAAALTLSSDDHVVVRILAVTDLVGE